ncbi:MAG TPA: hypothetical protein VGK59_09095 [Ohtaekwangia sp.]
MEKIKKALRLFVILFMLMLAASGVGIMGVLNPNRGRFQDKEIQIELVEKKEDEEEEKDQE